MFTAFRIDLQEEEEDMELTEEDIDKIKEIARGNPLQLLAENVAPSIFGNEEIKKAIILQLAKGVKKQRGAGGTYTRGDINILLSGDPGQAKSVMGKETVLRCPNGRYVSGTRSSGVGLCASLRKDELLGSWALEAGIIVLCSGSLVVVDELDKMDKEQLSSLYEPLETQTVTLNKAGISATLKAETSILAAANPIKGKFDIRQPLASQIDLPPPLLNRFDLIFILLDKVDEARDRESVQHLFKVHTGTFNEQTIDPLLFKKFFS
jgi:DNA replicative helicase MCM subunit Mcm2 (Cdc46/Mcm family)